MTIDSRSLTFLVLWLGLGASACRPTDDPTASTERDPVKSRAAQIELGKRLVTLGGCGDCHTPMKMGANGPERDLDRLLSGHPEGVEMPPAPDLPPGPWLAVVGATMTAWHGPWGTTFTANLTPDRETGLGAWSEEDFIATIRTGRHLGKGRPILPPMPLDVLNEYTDEELAAVLAYLQSLPPVKNRVPAPVSPRKVEAADAVPGSLVPPG